MLLKISCRQPGQFAKYIADDTIIPTAVVLLNYQEWQYTSIGDNPSFEGLIDYVNKYEIPLTIINGADDSSPLLHDETNERYRNVQPIICWTTYFITSWFEGFTRDLGTARYEEDLVCAEFNQEFDYLYVSLNNKPHPHRCLLIDLLAKCDLLKEGAVTWNSWYNDEGRLLDQFIRYTFRYWQPEILLLDEIESGRRGWETQLPDEYKHSFVQLISESSPDVIFITEKIVPSLFFNKLFLVSGAVHYHKKLQDLGFVLYDDVFDYSFDSEPDPEVRYTMLINNLLKLQGHTKDQLSVLYQLSLPKIQHNKKNLIRIAKDISFFPDYLVDLCENNPKVIEDTDAYFLYNLRKAN